MDEVERRLMEAVERLERQYEEQRRQIQAFENASLEHLNQRMSEWAPLLDALKTRQDEIEKRQRGLTEALSQLSEAFDEFASNTSQTS